MKQFDKTIRLASILAACSLLTACDKKGTATVTCGKMQSFEGRSGTINTPHFALGSLVALNTKTLRGIFLGSVTSNSGDQTVSPPVGSEDLQFESGVDIQLSANIPVGITADVKTSVLSQSVIQATNVKRVSLNDPAGLTAKNSDLKARIKAATSEPGVVVMVISSIIYTDKVGIELKNSVGGEAGAKVMTYGDYKLSVTYHCSEVLKMQGAQFGGLFKYSIVKYVSDPSNDPTKDSIQLDVQTTIDLSKYDLNASLR